MYTEKQILNYTVAQLNELGIIETNLIKHATQARENSYSPYSNFMVGTALLLESGKIIEGANQENASYPICVCAEQNVLSTWGANYSTDPVIMMAIVAGPANKENNQPVSPCGACRQSIVEYTLRQRRHFKLLLKGTIGPVYCFEEAASLLPLAFNRNSL
jgi:cytidine deaminase